MQMYSVMALAMLMTLTLASAIPKPEEPKVRVLDKDLSDAKHYNDLEHNPEYDHEAFLGREGAEEFDQLTPEESMDRLGIIYDKIDTNQDGLVSEEELRLWIKYVAKKYIVEDTERQWKEYEIKDDQISWEDYQKHTYGSIDDEGGEYADMVKRDHRRWLRADAVDAGGDGNGKLTKKEFTDFLHPEESEHMSDVVVVETLEDIDKDNDGYITEEEYIVDMWPDQEDGQEPEWVKTEREQFHEFRDKNKDGKLDANEVKEWIMPDDYDHTDSEAKHLIHQSDLDLDGLLTKEEVVDKYDIFVGSQATDFGEALSRHDEF